MENSLFIAQSQLLQNNISVGANENISVNKVENKKVEKVSNSGGLNGDLNRDRTEKNETVIASIPRKAKPLIGSLLDIKV